MSKPVKSSIKHSDIHHHDLQLMILMQLVVRELHFKKVQNKIAISIKLFNVQKGGSVSSAKILVFLFEKIYVRVSISLARALSKFEKKYLFFT